MTIDLITKNVIKKKAEEFAFKGEQIQKRISEEIDYIIKTLEETKKELIGQVAIEFSTNIYAELLSSIESGNYYTDNEIKSILSKEIPSNFGPSMNSFNLLREKIESLRLWKDKKEWIEDKSIINPLELIPKNLRLVSTTYDSISICWDKVDCDCYYEIELESPTTQKIYQSQKIEYIFSGLKYDTEYKIRVRTVLFEKNVNRIWSDPIIIKTLCKPWECFWKKCPDYVSQDKRYIIEGFSSRTATMTGDCQGCGCTIVGNIPLPPNKVTSWKIKLRSMKKNGSWIQVGVAPSDISQNNNNFDKGGWLLDLGGSNLRSGPPHNYLGRVYGPRKEEGTYVHTGDSVGVMMDTARGDLSFALNGANYGVAFDGIPLDKPFVPCVILCFKDESVELII